MDRAKQTRLENSSVDLPEEKSSSGDRPHWIGRYEEELLFFLEKEYGGLTDQLKTAVIYCSLFVRAGHVCLPLSKSVNEWRSLLDLDPTAAGGDRILSSGALLEHPAAGLPGEDTPFVVDGGFFFMRKYYNRQLKVREEIKSISSDLLEDFDPQRVQPVLEELFPENTLEADFQKTAAVLALRKRFLVVSGGPGTGKTTTVSRIIQLLERTLPAPPRMVLAAPTGKAAARMPGEAVTLHRLLRRVHEQGMLPPVEKQVLPFDLIVVDEASMIDLTLMERLLKHLGAQTRLILIGDRDQLASVEAGAVLSDICRKQSNEFSAETIEFLQRFGAASGLKESPPAKTAKTATTASADGARKTSSESGTITEGRSEVDDSIVYLTRSYRFGEESGIGRLAGAVNRQDSDEVLRILSSGDYPDLSFRSFDYSRQKLSTLYKGAEESILQAQNKQGKELLEHWLSEIHLGVLRRGPAGTDRLNAEIEEYLIQNRIIYPRNGWYHGRPILITRNDYSLGVFNGDPGVCIASPGGSFSVLFSSPEGGEKVIAAHRITHYEPAWLLTVHKSQGSEFDKVHLLLPPQDTPLLTRELIYTAVTRARKQLVLHGDASLLRKAVGRKTERFTGALRL